VARLLILGGGCRGLALARELGEQGHVARVVSRSDARRAEIEAAGAECWIGDPDRLGTLRGALEGVAIACWLLGTARGPAEQLRALHGPRLRAFVAQSIDTTVRGLVYEAAGSVPAAILREGERGASEIAARNSIPLALLHADPAAGSAWLERARGAVADLLRSERDPGGPGLR
jgi:uncharacterized protein YbjT (DUF2867 family)